jgi:hypothetical protein
VGARPVSRCSLSASSPKTIVAGLSTVAITSVIVTGFIAGQIDRCQTRRRRPDERLGIAAYGTART